MRVLVISPHIDDAECGACGTIYRHILAKDSIYWHTIVSGGYSVPEEWSTYTLQKEFEEAMATLGLKKYKLHDFNVDTLDRITSLRDTIFRLWHDIEPDVAYVPWRFSRHQDHRSVGDCAYQVSWGSKTDIRAYTVPNDFDGFRPSVFSELTQQEFVKKMDVIHCYKSQFASRKWFTDNALLSFMSSMLQVESCFREVGPNTSL